MSTPDRAQLLAEARAYLEWEQELTGFGLAPPALTLAASVPSSPAEQARLPQTAREPAVQVRPAEPVSVHASTSMRDAPSLVDAPSAPRRALPKLSVLAQLAEEVRGCARCELAKTRTHTVFARGNPESPVVFVGEGPGQEEDRVGAPFVGAAGQLLDKMVGAMGFARDDVYICNVVKCRPPNNRTPLPVEASACSSYLYGQLDAIAPRVIVALGRCAAENMGLVQGGGWRGRWGSFRGVDVMPTYHPAFLLRSPEFKRPVWEDLQKVMAKLKGA